MKQRLISWLLGIVLILGAPLAAMAQEDEADKIYDARLEGYPTNVTLDSGSTALSWMLLLALGAVCVGVMFKSANRSHLD